LSGRASMDVSTWGVTGSTVAANDFGKRLRVADTASRITFSANHSADDVHHLIRTLKTIEQEAIASTS